VVLLSDSFETEAACFIFFSRFGYAARYRA
jgi:hypothetical protein